ncbi:MAG: hypothetical protein Q9188_002903 [Gyalolechia gomerana]
MGYGVGGKLSNARGSPEETTSKANGRFELLEDLIDEIIDSNRRSDFLESQMPLVKGPLGHELRKKEEPTTHSYASDEFDCPQFQRDIVKKASRLLPYLFYPIPFSSPNAPSPYTRPLTQTQSFYAQIRAIEAETGCYFNDTFMIDTERAVDYAKVWVDTFQRRERPCEGIGK